MATRETTDSTVIDLDAYRVRRAAARRSREISEAMRRHPSYLGTLPVTPSA